MSNGVFRAIETRLWLWLIGTSSMVFNVAYRILGNVEDAEDAAQEVFIRVYAALPRFCGDAKFSVWLYSIVSNVCRSQWKKQSRDTTLITQKRQVVHSNPVLQRIEAVQRTAAATSPVIIGIGRKTPSNHTIQTIENTESVMIHSLHPKNPLFTTLPNINPSLLIT